MSVLAPCGTLVAVLAMILSAFGAPADGGVARASDSQPSAIVVGFVGGFVSRNNLHHLPVQLAQRLRHPDRTDTRVMVFENRHRKQAERAILELLDTNRDGILSAEEKNRARIVLFGHSWGASAAVLLARDLQRDGVPVLLTVQVDSVHKFWQNDAVIPGNVAEAVNFYQPHGWIHGRAEITAADPSRTRILGNYLSDYKKNPVECSGVSWYDRFFTPGHAQSECDHPLWSRIEDLVRQRLMPASLATVNPQP